MNNEIASSAPLERARQRQAEMRAAGVPVQRRNPIEKANANPTNLRAAIDAKCFDCEGGDADPCIQWRIGNCVCPDCPLYPVRPHQRLFGADMPAALRPQTPVSCPQGAPRSDAPA